METFRQIIDFAGTYSFQVLATATIAGLSVMLYCTGRDKRELRAELKRVRDIEDARRGIGDYSTCVECDVNIPAGDRLCRTCLQTCLQSGSH